MSEEDLIRVLTTEGVLDLEVVDQDERSLAASHWNAVKRYLGTGKTDRLDEFKGQTVAGFRPETDREPETDPDVFELATDPDVIDERESDGELDIERIYTTRR
jgi:hypothetical protein